MAAVECCVSLVAFLEAVLLKLCGWIAGVVSLCVLLVGCGVQGEPAPAKSVSAEPVAVFDECGRSPGSSALAGVGVACLL